MCDTIQIELGNVWAGNNHLLISWSQPPSCVSGRIAVCSRVSACHCSSVSTRSAKILFVCLTAWTSSLPPQGKLSLYNSCDGTEHIFTLRGVGEHPLPVDHVVLHCTVGETTHTQLDVPNYSQNKLILKV